MTVRKHCKVLHMVTVRMSRDERERLNAAAADAGVSLNTFVRRKLGFADGAKEKKAGLESQEHHDQS